ncbi:MAG: hypothetical protein PHP70_03815 [Gallionella sp.]|nr:hypothetical protein [Gallionella sp.]
MNDTSIPIPKESGSDGHQVKADVSGELVQAQPLTHMVQAITGLAASNARFFGGEVASTLIAGATSQMSAELAQTKQELGALRQKYEVLSNSFADERIQKAILAERIDSFRSSRHLKNIGISVGTLLLGIGAQLIKIDYVPHGIASIVIGALLVLLSWLSVPKGADK